eukprot:CAMPEP_0117449270 /NCGR_PEP_ID=MMETSP0759-20121206/7857_1 /TAXON_ID=63605 /ORGANISM="Percolomonas cosmopolitus, Strain WS" /LENGTH=460 /DNA_ID=CAMNT_0005241737 /DNA_START=145 /DNA_END=1528 /DNA_ORIENTATION=-
MTSDTPAALPDDERIPDLTSYSAKDTSWAQSLHNYMAMKHHAPQLPASSEDSYRYCRAKSFEWRMARFNPVRQVYTNSQEEGHNKEQEVEKSKRIIHRGHEKQLRNEATRDFLKGWNERIPKEGHQFQGVTLGEYMEKPKQRRPDIPHSSDQCQTDYYSLIGKRTKLNWEMEMNVGALNPSPSAPADTSAHEYIKKQTQNAYKKYRSQHFDPVLQRFLNPNREVAFLQESKQKNRARQTIKEDRHPNFLKTSESQAYDLFNHHIKKEDLIPRVDRTVHRTSSTKKYVQGQELVKKNIRQRNKEEHKKQQRVERRFKERSTRLNISIQHGFDIVNNKPFLGVDSIKPHVPLEILNKKSMWDTLNGAPAASKNNSQRSPHKRHAADRAQTARNGMIVRSSKPKLAATMDNIRPQTTAPGQRNPMSVATGSARAAIKERRKVAKYSRSLASCGGDRPRTAGFA